MIPRLAAAGLGALALLAALPASAAGPSCHCFRDRDYDPARPAAADPYLLATAANSLLAAVSGAPKRDIVQARMAGASGEDLWIVAHASARLGLGADAVRRARAAAGSWRAALDAGDARLGARFAAAVGSGAGDDALARAAAAETLAERVGTPWEELDALAARGATLQETVLASLLGRWSGRPPREVYAASRGGGSWGALLAAAGRTPRQIDAGITETLRPPRP